MANEGKSGGGGGGPATKAANAAIDKMGRATGGEIRQVAGQRINSADVVNQSLDAAKKMPLDLDGARNALQHLGHKSPPDALIQRYAHEQRILKAIEKMTGANATGQSGKWNMSTADTLHRDFNKYLWRRVHGIRQSWSGRK